MKTLLTSGCTNQRGAGHENQVVCVESLKVRNIIRNPKQFRAIADANWGEFTRQLEYKAELGGRTVVAINQFFPS